MATFHPNPNEGAEPWIERSVQDDLGFRIWHVIFFCFAGVIVVVIFICCCIKIRVPRTKQEIEADYQRKKIATKFREKLTLIENQQMDAMDLKRALEIIQEDLSNENKNISEQLSLTNNHEITPKTLHIGMPAEPQQPTNGGITNRLASFIKANQLHKQDFSCAGKSMP